MQRDAQLYQRTEFGWFLGALTVGTTVTGVLPLDWWWGAKLLLGVVFAFALLPLLGWLSGLLGRVLRFLLVPVVPLPGAQASTRARARLRTGHGGDVDMDDPSASRVLVEYGPDDLYAHYVMPPGTDPVPQMWETVKTIGPKVLSVRAMRGLDQVEKWTPTRRARILRAWRRAASTSGPST